MHYTFRSYPVVSTEWFATIESAAAAAWVVADRLGIEGNPMTWTVLDWDNNVVLVSVNLFKARVDEYV